MNDEEYMIRRASERIADLESRLATAEAERDGLRLELKNFVVAFDEYRNLLEGDCQTSDLFYAKQAMFSAAIQARARLAATKEGEG